MKRMIVRVGQTALGNAVFAELAFERGDEIGRIDGDVIDDPQYESNYGMDLGGTLTLEPVAPFRFLNHSCEPNCELVMDEEGEDGKFPSMWLCALADIAPDDELTIDYCWPAKSAIPCACNRPTCRGWIVDPEELDQLPELQSVEF